MKIKTPEQLEKYLAELAKVSVEDAIKSHEADSEKTYQTSVSQRISSIAPSGNKVQGTEEADDEKLFKGSGGRPNREEPKEKPELDIDDPSQDEEPEQQGEFTPEDITVDAIIDKLNIIRSGRSMTDKDIMDQMDSYVRGLDDPERVALFGFLKGIGQIVAADTPAKSVKEPDEEPYDVKMKRVKDLERNREEKKKALERDVQSADRALQHKGSDAKPKKRVPGSEDTSPPIRVGSRTSESVRRSMKESLQ